jgi:hypothetical protein
MLDYMKSTPQGDPYLILNGISDIGNIDLDLPVAVVFVDKYAEVVAEIDR